MRIICEYAAKIAKEATVAYPKYYPALTWRKWGNSSKASVRTANAPAEIRTGTYRTEVHRHNFICSAFLNTRKCSSAFTQRDTCTLPLF